MIRLRSLGGDGQAEVDALIGDKLLDLFLYSRLLRKFASRDTGKLTALRGQMMSNENLASIGHQFVVPHHLTLDQWEAASVHEKGTAVEAILGRQFLADNQDEPHIILSSHLVTEAESIVTAILTAAERNVSTGAVGDRNPSAALFEYLHKQFQLVRPARCVTVSGGGDGVKLDGMLADAEFVGEFRYLDLCFRSAPCPTKRSAQDSVARLALAHFGVNTSVVLENVAPRPAGRLLEIALPISSAGDIELHSQAPSSSSSSTSSASRRLCPSPSSSSSSDSSTSGVTPRFRAPCPESLRTAPTASCSSAIAISRSTIMKNPVALLNEYMQAMWSVKYPGDAIAVRTHVDSGRFVAHFVLPPGAAHPLYTAPIAGRPECTTKKGARLTCAMAVIDTLQIDNTSSWEAVVSNITPQSTTTMNDAAAGNVPARSASSPSKRRRGNGVVPADVIDIDQLESVDVIDDSRTIVSLNILDVDPSDTKTLSSTSTAVLDLGALLLADAAQDARQAELAGDCLASMSSSDMALLNVDGDVSLDQFVFTTYTPWDSTPLRAWFDANWRTKQMNALAMLKWRIDATFDVRMYRCRLGQFKKVRNNPDLLVYIEFTDGDRCAKQSAVGVGMKSGLACRQALLKIWPKIKAYIDEVIANAEARIQEQAERDDERFQLQKQVGNFGLL
ncbi:hypothetical protein BC828DRAFT_408646 [Blastocladiella britannica]|nr:hypothetical protein BC828DRAFT_408646 [Blastocladiella britannica]